MEDIKVYPASKVDVLLKEAADTGLALLDMVESQTKEINSLRVENSELSKQAQSDKVILEKVAATSGELDAFGDKLVAIGIIDRAARDSYVQKMRENPLNIVKIASQVIDFSTPPVNQGRGISKSAGDTSGESDNSFYNELKKDGFDVFINGDFK